MARRRAVFSVASSDNQFYEGVTVGDIILRTTDGTSKVFIGTGQSNASFLKVTSNSLSVPMNIDVASLSIAGKEAVVTLEDVYTSANVLTAPTSNALRAVSDSTLPVAGGTISGNLAVSGTFQTRAFLDLVQGYTSTSTLLPPAANAVKAVYDSVLPRAGGTVTGSLAVMGTLAPIAISGLVSGYTSTSTTLAPTANAIKAVYDTLNVSTLKLTGGTLSGSLYVAGTFAPTSISGLVTGFTSTSTMLPPSANAVKAVYDSTLPRSGGTLTGNLLLPSASFASSNGMPWAVNCSTGGDLSFSNLANTYPQVQFMKDGLLWAGKGLATTSDERLKDIVRLIPAFECLEDIRKLGVIQYRFKESVDQTLRSGFGASNVQSVMPDAVREGGNGMMAVDHAVLLSRAVGAIQNIDKRLTAIEATLSSNTLCS